MTWTKRSRNAAGITIARIFAQQGETAFRELEHQELENLSGRGKGVVALGGGALLAADTRRLAEASGTIICLDADQQEILRRLKAAPSRGTERMERPLLEGDSAARLSELLAKRRGHYASFPLRLDTTRMDAEQAAWQLQILLGRYRVGLGSSTQEILVCPGGLDALGQLLSEREFRPPGFVVSDSNIAPLYAERALAALENGGIPARLAVVPAGEASKNIDSLQMLWDGFLEAGLERGSTVIALGGGVVGDLAGFAAATYLRGIQWVSLPTSLLAMVDASWEVKPAWTLRTARTWWAPSILPAWCWPMCSCWPLCRKLSCAAGWRKRSSMGSSGTKRCSAGPPVSMTVTSTCAPHPIVGRAGWGDRETSELISRAMAVKIGIVEQDPYEKGLRAALNFGHTVGHALEVVSAYRLRHGEAVSIGMVVEARLAERLEVAEPGLAQSIAKILIGRGSAHRDSWRPGSRRNPPGNPGG